MCDRQTECGGEEPLNETISVIHRPFSHHVFENVKYQQQFYESWLYCKKYICEMLCYVSGGSEQDPGTDTMEEHKETFPE